MPISESELKAILAAERAAALGSTPGSRLANERERALSYYLGDMTRDMPSLAGRSTAVSSDVADTVEGMMPELMEIFAGGDEVVMFTPVGPEDEEAAAQETDYINHVFWEQNEGFLVLYSMIKDALLQKLGIAKVWWEKGEKSERETYYNQTADAFALITSDPAIEVIEHSEHDGLHDVTVVRKSSYGCVRVEAVPPEEFGVAATARSLRDARYCYHLVIRRVSDLIAQGYDAEQVRSLKPTTSLTNIERTRRDTVQEGLTFFASDASNDAAREVEVIEHYIYLDYEQDGNPGYYRIVTGGEDGEVLRLNGKPDIERIDRIPFAAITPVIITHRLIGRSIADLVIDIQRIKTAILRGMMDATYLAVYPRPEVAQSHATPETLNDLLTFRAGAPIRVRQPGGISWTKAPDVAQQMFPVLQYLDAQREWRTGVTRQGQGVDPNALQNQVATIAHQMFNAAQAKIRLIARIFAQTGIRDLFLLLHETVRKHGEQAQIVRLRNRWVEVDPRNWKTRKDMTVNVGLGYGSRTERLAGLQMLIAAQKEALAAGMVSPRNLWESAQELARLLGHRNAERFFVEPGSEPADPMSAPIQQPPDPKLQEIAARIEIEKTQALADAATEEKKAQFEMELERQRFEFQKELELLRIQAKIAGEEAKARASGQNVQPQNTIHFNASDEVAGKLGEHFVASQRAIEQAMAALIEGQQQLAVALQSAASAIAAPKRVIRDENGRIIGAETVTTH
jgi:hypothetical protein